MGGDVVSVLEGVDHGFLFALLLEAGYTVGVDAALGDDVGSAAGWGIGELGEEGLD